MLHNIFLLKANDFHDLDQLDIYSYPEDITKKKNKNLIEQILKGHNNNKSTLRNSNTKINTQELDLALNNSKKFIIQNPVPQLIEDLNICTTSINDKIIIGFIFDKDDNPYDYQDFFIEISDDLLNNEECCSFEDELDIENFLITLFIDLRKFSDEIIEKCPETVFHQASLFTKVFLFGIDEVGKTSIVRRIKTGKFNDNYFASTRKFNIEYIQRKLINLAIWDLPGQKIFREKWLTGLQDSNVLVYMIDVANQIRFAESKKELWNILKNYELNDIPLLVIGNKVDLLNHSKTLDLNQFERTKAELIEFYELEKIINREWKILLTSVKTNYNIEKVIEYIYTLTYSKKE